MYKLWLIIGLFIFSTISAYAGHFYLAPTLMLDTTSSADMRSQTIKPRFSAGYGGMLSPVYYLGIEANTSPKSFQVGSNRRGEAGNNINTAYTMGLSLLPGFMFDESTLAYLRIGGVFSNFSNLDARKSGLELGAGVEMLWDCPWSLRFEYDHIIYNSINGFGTPKSDDFAIGAVYRFD